MLQNLLISGAFLSKAIGTMLTKPDVYKRQDIVLMKSSLLDVATAIQLSKKTITNIKENLFWALLYNSIGIPLAAGIFFTFLGWKLNPMFGAAAMSLSSVCVVSNALRLKFFKPRLSEVPVEDQQASVKTVEVRAIANPFFDHKEKLEEKNQQGDDSHMTTKVIQVEGMSCPHLSLIHISRRCG